MNFTQFLSRFLFVMAGLSFFMVSCSNDDDETPFYNEPINILTPDSTTVVAPAGSTFNFSLYLATDVPIDTLRVGYLIDTAKINTSIPFSIVDTVVISSGFDDINNVQTFSGSFTLPDSVTNIRAFRPYVPAQQNPVFVAEQYDAVRVVFRMEATGKTFEKQMKVIIQ